MKELNVNVKLKFKGYRIQLYGEELGYQDLIVLPNNLEDTLKLIKKNAKNIISDKPYEEIFIYNIYEIYPKEFGQQSYGDYKDLLKIKGYFFEDLKEKVKIYFNSLSEKLNKLRGNKVKSYKIKIKNTKNSYMEEPEYICEIDNKYYLFAEDLYEIPKNMYSFVEELIKHKKE